MKKLLIFLLVVPLLNIITVSAQKGNYVEGFIITRQNDTLACSIQKRNWKKQPVEIKVKSAQKDTVVSPGSVRGFIIPSLQIAYVTKTIRPANFVDKFQNATILKDPEYDTLRTVFLKQLHTGTINLYLYYDGLGRQHFFIEAPDNFLEIYAHYFLYLSQTGRIYDEPVTILNRQFEFVLKVLMTPCRNVFSIIEAIQLNEVQLKGLFEVYDKCMESKKDK